LRVRVLDTKGVSQDRRGTLSCYGWEEDGKGRLIEAAEEKRNKVGSKERGGGSLDITVVRFDNIHFGWGGKGGGTT